jgi:hypothetical protein
MTPSQGLKIGSCAKCTIQIWLAITPTSSYIQTKLFINMMILNANHEKVGAAVRELLRLKQNSGGRVETDWGTKSDEGLGKCIKRILEDNSN